MFKLQRQNFILFVAWLIIMGPFLLVKSAKAGNQLQCKDLFFDSNRAIVLSGIKYLVELELSFTTDIKFQQDSIYRTFMLEKFKVEFKRLVELGGEDAKKEYYLQKEQIKSNFQKKAAIDRKIRNEKLEQTNIEAGKFLSPKLLQEVFIGSWVHGLDVSPDSKYIFSGTSGKNLEILDFKTGKPLFEVPHEDGILSVTASKDGQFVVTGSRDKNVRIISVTTQKIIHTIPHGDQVFSVSMSPDGKSVITGSDSGKVRVIDLASGAITKTVKVDGWPKSVVMAADLKTIVIGTSISNVVLKIDSTKSLFQSFINKDKIQELQLADSVFNIRVDEDLKYLIIGGNKFLQIRDYATGDLIKELHLGILNRGIAISSKNNFGRPILATGSSDNYVRLYDLMSGELMIELEQTGEVSQVVFTSDGKYLLIGTVDGFIKIYDLYTLKN